MVMGIPGAGKTRLAQDFAARGYERLNRDERGGSLRDVARALDARLSTAPGASSWTTPISHAPSQRRDRDRRPLRKAIRCLWLSTPLARHRSTWSRG